MKDPLVSVVVPTYNNEKKIATIIERVLSQPYKKIELIVVNDGSRDATASVVDKYVNEDRRVRMLSQVNRGASAARNAGIGVATGVYLMFFDADDDIDDRMIGEMVGEQIKHKKSMVVCGKLINGKALLPKESGIIGEDVKVNVVGSILRDGLLYSPCNKIYVADIVRKNDLLFNEKVGYGEDLIFNLAYLEHMDSVYYIRKPLYKYLYSKDGFSAKNAKNKSYRMAMYKALEEYVGNSPKSLRLSIAMKLIRLRWSISVQKAKILEGKRG